MPDGPSPSPVITVTTSITAEPGSECPAGSGNLWAEVDPVPDIQISRPGNITIRGTTNVKPGELLRIDIMAYSMHPSPMEYYPELWIKYTASVMNGDGGINTWSAEVRPEDFEKPDLWMIGIMDVRSGRSIGFGSVNVTA